MSNWLFIYVNGLKFVVLNYAFTFLSIFLGLSILLPHFLHFSAVQGFLDLHFLHIFLLNFLAFASGKPAILTPSINIKTVKHII